MASYNRDYSFQKFGIFIKIITAIRRYVIGTYHLKHYCPGYRYAVGFILLSYNHYMVGFIFIDLYMTMMFKMVCTDIFDAIQYLHILS